MLLSQRNDAKRLRSQRESKNNRQNQKNILVLDQPPPLRIQSNRPAGNNQKPQSSEALSQNNLKVSNSPSKGIPALSFRSGNLSIGSKKVIKFEATTEKQPLKTFC